MTQEQLAFKARLDRTYISMLENNRVALPTLTVICDALDADPAKIGAAVNARDGRQSGRTRNWLGLIPRHHRSAASADPLDGTDSAAL